MPESMTPSRLDALDIWYDGPGPFGMRAISPAKVLALVEARDAEIQGLRGANAALRIQLRTITDILDGSKLTSIDMEYWDMVHDRVAAVVAGLAEAERVLARETECADMAWMELAKRLEEAVRLLRLHLDAPHMDHRSEVEAFLAAHEQKSGKGGDQTSPAFTKSSPGGTLPNSPGSPTAEKPDDRNTVINGQGAPANGSA